MSEVLDDEAVEAKLPSEWHREGEEIVRTYEFDDYLNGVDFTARVGEVAEEEFHHPEIVLRYGEVEVRLTSHEAGGITDQDIRLAKLFDEEY
jgi:4a-hydroxytetrahydrobiopterin dehydratase